MTGYKSPQHLYGNASVLVPGRRPENTWEKLEKGDYDWAHLSYSIWPERVKDKCIKDKSLAIAHGLEDVYIEPPAKAKKAKKASTEALDLE